MFCQVVLNKWDYAVLIEPKQRVVDRARGVYRNRARSLSLCAPGSRGGRRGYAHLCLDAAMRREPRRDAAGRAAESGLSGAEAHDPVASRGAFVPVGTRGTTKGAAPRHARGRVEKVFEIAKQGGRVLPARVLFWRGDFLQAPPDVPRGHRGDQDDVGRAGLVQDLACDRVDAGDPARAVRDRVQWAADHHRAREEDERGARSLRDQGPGHHRAASCGLRKCRELRVNLFISSKFQKLQKSRGTPSKKWPNCKKIFWK